MLIREHDFATLVLRREHDDRHRLATSKRRIRSDRARMNDDVEASFLPNLPAGG
jgi:hypothetical protein